MFIRVKNHKDATIVGNISEVEKKRFICLKISKKILLKINIITICHDPVYSNFQTHLKVHKKNGDAMPSVANRNIGSVENVMNTQVETSMIKSDKKTTLFSGHVNSDDCDMTGSHFNDIGMRKDGVETG